MNEKIKSLEKEKIPTLILSSNMQGTVFENAEDPS